MKVYHASPCVVSHPDAAHSRNNLDFGRGFYVTTIREQAIAYAERFLRRDDQAFLNEYEFNEDALSGLSVCEFETYDGEWLDFVMTCRNGEDVSNWDVVIGGVADDRVFTTVDLFFAGEISRKEALDRLMYVRPNDQLCLRTQEALNTLLTFVGAQEVQ